MFLRAFKSTKYLLNNNNLYLKTSKHFSTEQPPPPPEKPVSLKKDKTPVPEDSFDPNLLFVLTKERTFQALDKLLELNPPAESGFNSKNLVLLDKLSTTPYSETYRVYDTVHKTFYVEKTFGLDSEFAWNQLNFILRQYFLRSQLLSDVLSIDYDRKLKRVKVFGEIERTTMNDYSHFLADKHFVWTTELLKVYIWEILNHLHTLRRLDATCLFMRPQNFFIDQKVGYLRLFDYSDFRVGKEGSSRKVDAEYYLDSAVHTLVQILNPYNSVRNAEEGWKYLGQKHPEFEQYLNQVKATMKDIDGWRTKDREDKVMAEIDANLSTKAVPIEAGFIEFLADRLKVTLEARGLSNTEELWNDIKQTIHKD